MLSFEKSVYKCDYFYPKNYRFNWVDKRTSSYQSCIDLMLYE